MGQGQYSTADIDTSKTPPKAGQYAQADIDFSKYASPSGKVTLDFSKAQPIDPKTGVALDFSKAKSIDFSKYASAPAGAVTAWDANGNPVTPSGTPSTPQTFDTGLQNGILKAFGVTAPDQGNPGAIST
jgi:hypothetical protein